jgi:hypothetical protein
MQEAQAALEERNALRRLNPSAPDYEQQLFKVNPQLGINYRKEAATTAAQEAARKKSEFDLVASRRKFGDELKRNLSANPSNENVVAWGQDAVLQGIYAEDQVATTVQQLLAIPPDQRASVLARAGATAGELKPQVITENLGGVSRVSTVPAFGGAPTVVSEATKTATPGEKMADARARENIAISQERLKRDSDPAVQQALAGAKATGEAIAKGDIAAKQALPRIISDAQTALDVVDQMVGKQEVRDSKGKLIQAATKPHPGFQNAVGATWIPGARFVPGTDAAGFQALQDQIEGTAFLSAFEALKGGGAISEKEGAKATAARLRMTLAQDEKEYVKAAREFQDIVRTGVENARRKGGAAPAGGASNVDTSNPLLK